MLKKLSFLAAFCLFLSYQAKAQQIVHVVSGVATLDVERYSKFKVIVDQNVTSVVISPSVGVPNLTAINVLFVENSAGGFSVTFGGNTSGSCTITTTANAGTACALQFDGASDTWFITGGAGSGGGDTITTVAGLATVPGKTKGTIAVVLDGSNGTDCTVGGGTGIVACQYNGIVWAQLAAASAGATAFSAITGGTNTAALIMGTGGSLTTSGTGTITATAVPAAGVTSIPGSNGQLIFNNAGALGAEDPVVSQPTASLLNAQVVGNIASAGADSGNPIKVGGVFNTTQPTVTTGQRVDQQMSARGEMLIAKGVSGFSIDNTGFQVTNTPTVTANAGTNLNTSLLQLDATGAKLNLAQASTTSGQTGPLGQCAVTTSAPSYTTAQTDPLSCNTSGGLRTDGSGVTQPVSAASLPLPTGAATSANQPAQLADNGAAAATNRLGAVAGIYRNDYHGGTAATAGRDAAQDVGTDGLGHVTPLADMSLKRYKASSKFAGSSTTDNWRISGNASNTVLVTKLVVTCTQTTAGQVTLELRKESAATSGGTAATVTNLPVDSNKAAASSVVQSFTGTGPTVGTLVADIDNAQFGCMASGTATPNDIYITSTSPAAPIAVLRGTAEGLAINFGGAITGGNLTVTVEWEEVTTITP